MATEHARSGDQSTPSSVVISSVVIVGGGLAGAKTVESLREQGYTGAVTLFAAEPHLPYERPPLSKGYLASGSGFDEALVLPQGWYAEHDVELRLSTPVESVDAAGHTVRLADGSTVGYDRLVLATGSTPRRLSVPGADAEGVLTLRTREDSDAIHAAFGAGRHLVIIGGGWIGLEVAAAARGAGTTVTVLEAGDLPLLGVLGPELAQVFADLHLEQGVDLRCTVQVAEVTTENGRASGVALAGGEHIPADAVVVGVGVTPQVTLAQSAGLAIEDGVLVDGSLRSSDPDIYAVGDIANVDHPVLGRRIRVEHWATALNQPAVAAASILGQDVAYTDLPYFYTDQYDLGMEYIGHVPKGSATRVVVRGDLASREFVAFWLDEQDRIRAAMNVNVWDVVDEVKPLIADGTAVDPKRLTDPAVAYADLRSA